MAKTARRPALEKLESWQDPAQEPYVRLENVTKTFEGAPVVNQVSLDIYQGEFFSILGPSGCGKSTLLRMLAGLEEPDSGKIYIDGVEMTEMEPYQRPVNMMFQSYALFPHMTVAQNVAFGLVQEGVPKPFIRDRVEDVLKLVQMQQFSKRYPHQMSGGQRQRVALARCLIKKPKVLLLDEPLAALDKKLREETQFELVNIQESLGITFIVVTHDQEEAMTMSTRLGVMEHGRIRQIGAPNEIYEFPNCEYVADFIGTMNVFSGIVVEESQTHTIVHSDELTHDLYVTHGASVALGTQVALAIRPEKIIISKNRRSSKHNMAKGVVENIGYLGDVSIYHIRLAQSGKVVQAMLPNLSRMSKPPIMWDDTVYLTWAPDSVLILTA